ncbi:hypothetical protein [Nonomuraea candida]|uniref:hypothetical protein n=1 Tax=Nonomuraea candida TaxID=359159 RepID=UPI000AF8E2FB|nr:hypothetical protein [Nonomuraea candida]
MRLLKQLVPVVAVTFAGYAIVGAVQGSALLTLLLGGSFGPEGSPYAVVFGLLLTIVFMWLARRRGNVVPRRWRAACTTW